MKSRSQTNQDIFVISMLDNSVQRYFVDIGCHEPVYINNTMLLEEHGWTGISLDIVDFSEKWKKRKTPFILSDALTVNYANLFEKYNLPKVVDYLTLDIEGDGLRYKALEKVMSAKYEYKIITIEHDSYRGYYETEAVPQRKLLSESGYTLLCSNVTNGGNPYEDWWINEKYIEKDLNYLKCDGAEHTDIINKINNIS